jgi:cysteate synthase
MSTLEVSLIQEFDERPARFDAEPALHYQLGCSTCGYRFEDDGWVLECPRTHAPSLLGTIYSSRRLVCDEKAEGLYRYGCWLPVARQLAGAGAPVTYKSERLCRELGLPNLWIAFSGYWPERGATLETGTFKELEAYGVLSRIRRPSARILVVASAGNTAAAFARICSENGMPCLIVAPASGVSKMQFSGGIGPTVKIISLTEDADYSDAIAFADAIARRDGFVSEGGANNVGRRDGAATVMLRAVETIGALPDYYFQAIGSGVGAIAAHEAAKRLASSSLMSGGRPGKSPALPRLMLGQNLPFAPMFDSWRRGRRELIEMERSGARALAGQIVATVLSNQRPPYAIRGGIFDALSESGGDVLAVGNEDVGRAMRLFEECEGIDIEPAAGVALASLMQALRLERIARGSTVLLHITGGGHLKRSLRERLVRASANLEIPLSEICKDEHAAVGKACDLF